MTDRELLEKAAKAAGMADAEFKDMSGWGEDLYGMSFAMWSQAAWDETGSGYWNPLTDDGDALRLAVKLNITTGFDALPDGAIVYTSAEWHDEWDRGFRIMEWLNKDSAAATRRAIRP